jgi:selenocysteine-specific elongation factor
MAGVDPISHEGIYKRIEYFIYAKAGKESSLDEISKSILVTKKFVEEILDDLQKRGIVLSLGQENYIHIKCYNNLLENVRLKIKNATSGNGILTLSSDEIQKGFDCSSRLWKALEKELIQDGTVSRAENTFILKDGFENLKENEKRIINSLISIYEQTEFKSPRPDELPEITHVSEKIVDNLLNYLFIRGILIRLAENVVLSRSVFIKAQNIVVNIICEQGELDSADFKLYIDSSRKYALAILDHLDSLRITVRTGNDRKLSPDYERRLIR